MQPQYTVHCIPQTLSFSTCSCIPTGVPGTTTVPDVSDEVPIAAVAGGAAGGALAVLLIVIIILIAVITAIVCVRKKKMKYVLDTHYSNSSPETVAFVSECGICICVCMCGSMLPADN